MDLDKLVWRTRVLTGTAHTDDPQETPADVPDAVNDAYLELANLQAWSWTAKRWTVTPNGDRTVELPADVDKVLSVEVPAKALTLTPRPVVAFAGDEHGGAGTPHEYALDGSDIILRPPPDSSLELEVRGTSIPGRLSSSDEPAFHEAFHPALSFAAAAELLERRPDEDPRVERYRQRAAILIDRLREHDQASWDENPMVMGGRYHERATERRKGAGGRRGEVW